MGNTQTPPRLSVRHSNYIQQQRRLRRYLVISEALPEPQLSCPLITTATTVPPVAQSQIAAAAIAATAKPVKPAEDPTTVNVSMSLSPTWPATHVTLAAGQRSLVLDSSTPATALKISTPTRFGKPSELLAGFPGIVDKTLGQIARFFDDPGSEPHLILYLEELVYYAVQESLYRSAPERQQHQYNPITRRLKIRGMSRPVHNALGRFVSRTLNEMVRQGWITAEECSLVDNGVQSVKLARCHFRVGDTIKKIPAWEKTLDGVFNFAGRDRIAKPMVV